MLKLDLPRLTSLSRTLWHSAHNPEMVTSAACVLAACTLSLTITLCGEECMGDDDVRGYLRLFLVCDVSIGYITERIKTTTAVQH